jgi:hypothetical protein
MQLIIANISFSSGFLIMGFDKAKNDTVIGTFNIPPTDQDSRTLDCEQYDVCTADSLLAIISSNIDGFIYYFPNIECCNA